MIFSIVALRNRQDGRSGEDHNGHKKLEVYRHSPGIDGRIQ
jgi:hypothetical protein